MLKHYASLLNYLRSVDLDIWAERLPKDINTGLSEQRYGDLRPWRQALEALPTIKPGAVDLCSGVKLGQKSDCSPQQYQQLERQLRTLIPWRKGPFSVFGIHIDSEWRSDWKWERL
nr:DUF1698 domain-containing protein [Cellvibrionaceae bacterium]